MDPQKPSEFPCHHVIYHGRVQGVGFRWTTVQIARRFAVAGYVKNRPDGTVEMVVRCESSILDEFLTAVEQAFEGHIDQRDIREATPDECFDIKSREGFEVR